MKNLHLTLDTTLQGAAVALFEVDGAGFRRLALASRPETFGSAAALPELVRRVLEEAGVTLADLQHLYVSQGPGSFTGIKVGLAFAAGLVAGRRSSADLSPCGVPALDSLAWWHCLQCHRPVVWLVPATRTHGFAALAIPDQPPNAWLIELTEEITFRNENGQAAVGLPDQSQCLWVQALPWEGLTEWGGRTGISLLRPEESGLMDESAGDGLAGLTMAAMIRRALSGEAGAVIRMPEPRYRRLSTPEEKLQNNRAKK